MIKVAELSVFEVVLSNAFLTYLLYWRHSANDDAMPN